MIHLNESFYLSLGGIHFTDRLPENDLTDSDFTDKLKCSKN
jgi:hypothetical protein